MEAPEDILPALRDMPLRTLQHYMGQFGVAMPQTRATRADCEALLRARLEALVRAPPPASASVPPRPASPRTRRHSLPPPAARAPSTVVADSGIKDEDKGQKSTRQSRSTRTVVSASARAAPSTGFTFPEQQQPQQPQQQQQQQQPPSIFAAPPQRKNAKKASRKVALGLLGVAGVLLAVAGAIWAQDVLSTQRYCDSSSSGDGDGAQTGVRCRACPTGAVCVAGHAVCRAADEVVRGGACVRDPARVDGVRRVCEAAAALLAEQRWLAAHCGSISDDDVSSREGALTAADIRRALQLAGVLRQADLPAFEAAALRGFCCDKDDEEGGDSEECTVVPDEGGGRGWYRSTVARAVPLSWCAVAVAWEHSRRVLALLALAGALAGGLAALRRRNRARTALSAQVAEAVVRVLQCAAAQSARDGSAAFRTEDALRAAAGAASGKRVDDACWALALAQVRHTPGVEREQRLLSGHAESVLLWCGALPEAQEAVSGAW